MKIDHTHAFIIHGVVRALLLNNSVDDACLRIFKQLLPSVVQRKFFISANQLPASHFQKMCDFLHQMDHQEIGYSSCYSMSVVVQIFAFVYGIESEMILGVKKQDEKLVGHAWVALKYGNLIHEISPGNVSTENYKIIRRFTADELITNWIEK